MAEAFNYKKQITLNTKIVKVWETLTMPKLTKLYMDGLTSHSRWKAGSPVEWADAERNVKVKGQSLEYLMSKKMVYTAYSLNSGMKDSPENYLTITFELTHVPDVHGGHDEKTIMDFMLSAPAEIEGGADSFKKACDAWDKTLDGLKAVAEDPNNFRI